MSSIGGKIRETSQQEFSKKVGLFEANVIAINPDAEECKEILGFEPKEDSKSLEYLGESKDGNKTLRVDVWLEEVKNKDKFKVTFYLEDKIRMNNDETKTQYINSVGTTTWSTDENALPGWFKSKDYRECHAGEADLYNFLRTWLSKIDYRAEDAVLEIEWKKLMKGNVKDLKEQIDGAYCSSIVALATIKTVLKEDETKEYQNVYSKAFLPSYSIKQFRLVDYSNPKVLSSLKSKNKKDCKPHEKFVIDIMGEYGCKDYFFIGDLKDYNPDDNFAASNSTLSEDGGDY